MLRKVIPRTLFRSFSTATPRPQARPRLVLDKGAASLAPFVFKAALKAGVVDEVEGGLHHWAKLVATNPSARLTLVMPGMTHEARSKLIFERFRSYYNKRVQANELDKSDSARVVIAATLVKVAKQGQMAQLGKLADAFGKVRKDHNKEVDCTIITADELDEANKEKVISAVKNYIAEDEKLNVTTQVDPSIVGGFIARFGYNELNLSLVSMVDRYKRQLSTLSYQDVIEGKTSAGGQKAKSKNSFTARNGTVITVVNGKPEVTLPPGYVSKKRERGVFIPPPKDFIEKLKSGQVPS